MLGRPGDGVGIDIGRVKPAPRADRLEPQLHPAASAAEVEDRVKRLEGTPHDGKRPLEGAHRVTATLMKPREVGIARDACDEQIRRNRQPFVRRRSRCH